MASATDSRSAKHDPSRDLPGTLLVAKIVRPHGIRGELKIVVHSDVADRFAKGRELILIEPAGQPRAVRIEASRQVRGGRLLKLENCDSRDAAEGLRGASLEIERCAAPPAPKGSFYHFELVGCRCRDHVAGELGTVVDVEDNGGGLLLRVQGAGSTLMVPFVEEFLEAVDVERGEIALRLPPGLVATCSS